MRFSARPNYIVKLLGAFAVGASALWLWPIFVLPWIKAVTKPEYPFIAFWIPMSLLLGLPAFLGLYFGARGLYRTDASTVKGLVATYCLGLAYLAVPSLPDAFGFVRFLVAAALVGLYMLVSRRLLRLLDLPLPAVRQGLPQWPIALLAFFLWGTLVGLIQTYLPVEFEPRGLFGAVLLPFAHLVFTIGSVALAFMAYKLGVRLFAQQSVEERSAGPADL